MKYLKTYESEVFKRGTIESLDPDVKAIYDELMSLGPKDADQESFMENIQKIQDEFDKNYGDEPKLHYIYEVTLSENDPSYGTIPPDVYGIYESYGPLHAKALYAIEYKDIDSFVGTYIRSSNIFKESVILKIEELKREIKVWENIKKLEL